MKRKYLLLVVLVVFVAATLGSCRQAASTPPASAATATGAVKQPGTQTMGLFETFATQTALAGGGGQPVKPGTPAPNQPAAATKVPPAAQQPAQPTQQPQQAQPTQPPAPAQPAVVVPPATPGLPSTYTLQKGEFAYCIARRFDVNPAELLNINGLSTTSLVYEGMTLKIPQTGNNFPDGRSLHSHPTNYKVASGDTIYSIACYFGNVDPLVIAQVNNLQAPYNVSTGQTLQIP